MFYNVPCISDHGTSSKPITPQAATIGEEVTDNGHNEPGPSSKSRDTNEDRSSDKVFLNTTSVVQSVIDLNTGLPYSRYEDYPHFVKVSSFTRTLMIMLSMI